MSGEWCLLPAVTRKQMELSRHIKCVFSGDLNRPVKAYPLFPGSEKHLLKAQIVRITHANLVAPNGLYKTNDDNGNIRETKDGTPKRSSSSSQRSTSSRK